MQRIRPEVVGLLGPRILTWRLPYGLLIYTWFVCSLLCKCEKQTSKRCQVEGLYVNTGGLPIHPGKRYLIDLPKAFHVQLNLDDTEVESRRWWNLSVWYPELTWKWWNFSWKDSWTAALFSGWTHHFAGPPVKAACVYSDLAGQKIPRTSRRVFGLFFGARKCEQIAPCRGSLHLELISSLKESVASLAALEFRSKHPSVRWCFISRGSRKGVSHLSCRWFCCLPLSLVNASAWEGKKCV